jgi:hypothetical protein
MTGIENVAVRSPRVETFLTAGNAGLVSPNVLDLKALGQCQYAPCCPADSLVRKARKGDVTPSTLPTSTKTGFEGSGKEASSCKALAVVIAS